MVNTYDKKETNTIGQRIRIEVNTPSLLYKLM